LDLDKDELRDNFQHVVTELKSKLKIAENTKVKLEKKVEILLPFVYSNVFHTGAFVE